MASCNRAGLNTHVPGAALNFVRIYASSISGVCRRLVLK